MSIDPKRTIAEITRRFPASLKVFSKYRIDLCCGGVHPLEFVAHKRGLDLAQILRELDEALKP